jgi:hypothetical protein
MSNEQWKDWTGLWEPLNLLTAIFHYSLLIAHYSLRIMEIYGKGGAFITTGENPKNPEEYRGPVYDRSGISYHGTAESPGSI